MSILYIRHPSKAAVDGALQGQPLQCAFALASDGGAIEREGVAVLADLSTIAGEAKRVVLLLAASDVSLLRIKVPPLSAAKLRLALPNMVEDQVIADPDDCVVVAAAAATAGPDGLRSVAVVERAWLEQLQKSVLDLGVTEVTALPSQLCLPYQNDLVSAVVVEQDAGIELAIRLSDQEGIGLPIAPDDVASPAQDVRQVLRAIVQDSAVILYVPQSSVPAYQELADAQITVAPDNWPRWIAGAKNNSLDLIAGLIVSNGPRIDWQRWRWPLVLATVIAAINITGLNIDWWRMKKEATSLRTVMLQTYKSAYPNGSLAHTPIEMMRQQINLAQRDSGLAAPDDFLTLVTVFGDAAGSIIQKGRTTPAIIGVEYRDHSLIVRFKSDYEVPSSSIKTALAARNLSVSQPTANVMKIGSGR